MTRTAREALRESIKHWERLWARTRKPVESSETPDDGDCPLCDLYGVHGCDGCPVANDADTECVGTPYYDAREAWYVWQYTGGKANRTRWRTAAQAEIDYLKGLLKG